MGLGLIALAYTTLLMTFVAFLVVAFLGAFVQTVTGFALGMILIALAAGMQLVSIPVLTATVSLLSLANVLMALRGQTQHIHFGFLRFVSFGQVPAIGLGLWLMLYLNEGQTALLQLLLGLFVLAGSLSMMGKNPIKEDESRPVARVIAGVGGGLCGGMFSASGPVMGWFFYRQPLPIEVIRPTLLACFGVTTSVRTLMLGVQGEINTDIVQLTGASLPMVVLGTWLGRRYAPRIEPEALRRYAFGLLTLMGLVISLRAGTAFL